MHVPKATLGALLACIASTAATCYSPNGTQQTSDYSPCNQFNADSSVCCSINKPLAGYTTLHDTCLSNGLCQWIDPYAPSDSQFQYFRNGCSDPSWPSATCLTDVCGGVNDVDDIGNAALTPCDNTPSSSTWCCGKNNTDCCGKGSAGGEVTLKATLLAAAVIPLTSTTAAPLSVSSSTGSIISTTTPSSTGFPSTTASPSQTAASTPAMPLAENQESTALTAAATAGVGVGAAVGGCLVIGLAIFLVLYKRKHNISDDERKLRGGNESMKGPDSIHAQYTYGYSPSPVTPSYWGGEMDVTRDPEEMESEVKRLPPIELEGNSMPDKKEYS